MSCTVCGLCSIWDICNVCYVKCVLHVVIGYGYPYGALIDGYMYMCTLAFLLLLSLLSCICIYEHNKQSPHARKGCEDSKNYLGIF